MSTAQADAVDELVQMHTISHMEDCVRWARAALDVCPQNDLLREFVHVNERLVAKGMEQLAQVG